MHLPQAEISRQGQVWGHVYGVRGGAGDWGCHKVIVFTKSTPVTYHSTEEKQLGRSWACTKKQ